MFDYKDISEEHLKAHIDRIIDVMKQIPLHKVTILTGGNALGKSLIRKQLPFHISEKLDVEGVKHDIRHVVSSTSMQLRTEQRPEWGALSSCMHDAPWASTSESTVRLINSLIKEDQPTDRFIVIDELEIGMSREVIVGMCNYINEHYNELINKSYGILVITHSEDVVRTLKHDEFINIEGMSEQEWITRTIEPVDPELLGDWADKLFRAIENRLHKV